jgi:hypothetical protein
MNSSDSNGEPAERCMHFLAVRASAGIGTRPTALHSKARCISAGLGMRLRGG